MMRKSGVSPRESVLEKESRHAQPREEPPPALRRPAHGALVRQGHHLRQAVQPVRPRIHLRRRPRDEGHGRAGRHVRPAQGQDPGQHLLRALDADVVLLHRGHGAARRQRHQHQRGPLLLGGQGREPAGHDQDARVLRRRHRHPPPRARLGGQGGRGRPQAGHQRRGRRRRAPHPGPARRLHHPRGVGPDGRPDGDHARRPQVRPDRPLPVPAALPLQRPAPLCLARDPAHAARDHRRARGQGHPPDRAPDRRQGPAGDRRPLRHPGPARALRERRGLRVRQGRLCPRQEAS